MQICKLNNHSGNRFFLLSVFLFMACFHLTGAIKQVTVIYTTDIHASFDLHQGNWLKLASIIKQQRGKAGNDNSLLIDCGDTIQGRFAGMYTRGLISLKMLNALKYDVWIPGNHDFDFGVPRFYELAAKFNGAILAGNVKLKKPLNSWKNFTRGGLKLAVIGLGNGSFGSYEPSSMRQIELLPAGSYLQRVMLEVAKSKPDIIILAMHNGRFSKKTDLYKLLRRFPEINLVLGGHTHKVEPGISTGRGWFLQAGSHARVLGQAVLQYDTVKRRLTIKSQLIPVKVDTPLDADAFAVIEPLLRQSGQAANKVIGSNVVALNSSRYKKKPSGISEFLGRATAGAAGTDYAFHDVPVKHACLKVGAITRGEVFNLMPYQNTICTLHLDRNQLTRLIKEQFRQSRKSGSRFLHPYGVDFVLNRSGSKVSSVVLSNGREMADNARVKVAFSSYAISGAGGRWPYLNSLTNDKKCNFRDTGISLYKALTDYIEKNSPLHIKPVKRIRYIKN
jgi:5'-nucleotidase / UDP-sugar diphosphatase